MIKSPTSYCENKEQ